MSSRLDPTPKAASGDAPAPENRLRREFAVLFESETILFEEALRIGGAFVGENAAFVQQGAVATAAAEIDALRQKLPPALLAEVQAFLKTDAGLKEREFLALALRIAAPAGEDTARAKQEEAAFYKGLAELSAQWRAAAPMTSTYQEKSKMPLYCERLALKRWWMTLCLARAMLPRA
mgnify:CR=1 FL=1